MALRATPTIAICLTAGIAAGVALARPDQTPVAPTTASTAAPAAEVSVSTEPDNDSPYLIDASTPDAAPTDAPVVEAVPVVEITIEGFAFAGSSSVAPGGSLNITNLDSAPHTLTAVDGSFDTGTLNQNESAALGTPATPGTYEYFCAIHPSMVGTITVG